MIIYKMPMRALFFEPHASLLSQADLTPNEILFKIYRLSYLRLKVCKITRCDFSDLKNILWVIFNYLKLWVAVARHNFKWVKMYVL